VKNLFGLRYTIGGGPFKEDDLLYPWIQILSYLPYTSLWR